MLGGVELDDDEVNGRAPGAGWSNGDDPWARVSPMGDGEGLLLPRWSRASTSARVITGASVGDGSAGEEIGEASESNGGAAPMRGREGLVASPGPAPRGDDDGDECGADGDDGDEGDDSGADGDDGDDGDDGVDDSDEEPDDEGNGAGADVTGGAGVGGGVDGVAVSI